MKRLCPECETEMQPIKLLDATHDLPAKTGGAHVELSYAAPEAKPSFWMKAIPSAGTIMAMLCPNCGRTVLYARPNA